MASFNEVILIGNLTRDPEIRYLASGSALTKFALAVDKWTPKGNKVLFVDVVAWDRGNYRLAETCNKYLRKGMSVLVKGELEIDTYEDRQGVKRKSTQINIDKMEMVGSRQPMTPTPGDAQDHRTAGPADTFDEPIEDEIPF